MEFPKDLVSLTLSLVIKSLLTPCEVRATYNNLNNQVLPNLLNKQKRII